MPDANGELTVDDVAQYTRDRLAADEDETQRFLDAARDTARSYCGWHVTPVREDTLTIDGPGGGVLTLPTQRLVSVDSISEDGTALDVAGLYVSERGLVRKRTTGYWSCNYGAITVTMSHGFDAAANFQAAVLELVDRMAAQVGNVMGNSGPAVEKRVDDASTRWVLTIGQSPQLFDMLNHTLLDDFQLKQAFFA